MPSPITQQLINTTAHQNSSPQPLTDSPSSQDPRIIFQLIDRVGSFGKYQKISLIAWCILGYLQGGLNLIIPYLFFQDPYSCAAEPAGQSCREYVCSLQPSQRQAYLPQPSMSSIANQFGDFRCSAQQNTLDSMILVIYSSMIVSNLFLSVFGDYWGRRSLLLAGLGTLLVGLVCSLVSPNLFLASTGLFIAFFGSEWCYNMTMNFINQTVCQAYRDRFQACAFVAYGIGQIANVAYFYLLADWKMVLIFFYIVPAAIALLLVLVFVVETPISLLKFRSGEQVKTQLLRIAKINDREDVSLQVEEIEEIKKLQEMRQNEEQKQSNFTLIDVFRYPSVRYMTLLFVIIEISIEFLFFGPNLMINQFQFNIFVNGLVLGGSSLLSYIFCLFVIDKFKRKNTAIITFTIVTICSFVMIFVWTPKDQESGSSIGANIGMLIALFILNFSIGVEFNFYQIYAYELYPTQVRTNGIGFLSVVGGITISASDFITDLCMNSGFSVMILFTIAGIAGIVASKILPESLAIPPPDMIPELMDKINSQKSIRSDKSSQQIDQRQQVYSDNDKPSEDTEQFRGEIN